MQMRHILEISDKEFKITVINTLKAPSGGKQKLYKNRQDI